MSKHTSPPLTANHQWRSHTARYAKKTRGRRGLRGTDQPPTTKESVETTSKMKTGQRTNVPTEMFLAAKQHIRRCNNRNATGTKSGKDGNQIISASSCRLITSHVICSKRRWVAIWIAKLQTTIDGVGAWMKMTSTMS